MSRYVAAFLLGLVIGAGGTWLVVGRGAGYDELRDAVRRAQLSDSLARLRIDTLERERDSVATRAATATVLYHETKAALDSVLGLPLRVDTIEVRDSTGALVPIRWVRKSDYDTLASRCLAFRNSCEAKHHADSLLILSERRVGLEWKIRADSLRWVLDNLPIPKEPSRWGFGCAGGYGLVVAAGEVKAGPGATCGLTLTFR